MFHKFAKTLLAMVSLIGLLSGTAFAQTKTLEDIIAWVNNDIILKSEYDKRLADIRAELTPQGEASGCAVGAGF